MAVTQTRTFNPKMPRLAHLNAERVAFDYERPSDTLFVYFAGQPLPAISVVVSDELLYLVDPETEIVVGLQIEAFWTRVIDRYPALLDVAEFIGITAVADTRSRDQLAPSDRKLKAVASILGIIPGQDRGSA